MGGEGSEEGRERVGPGTNELRFMHKAMIEFHQIRKVPSIHLLWVSGLGIWSGGRCCNWSWGHFERVPFTNGICGGACRGESRKSMGINQIKWEGRRSPLLSFTFQNDIRAGRGAIPFVQFRFQQNLESRMARGDCMGLGLHTPTQREKAASLAGAAGVVSEQGVEGAWPRVSAVDRGRPSDGTE